MTDPSQPQSQSSLFVTSPPSAATPAPSLTTSFSQSLNLNAQPSSSDTTTSTSTSNLPAPTPSTYQQSSTPLTPASSTNNTSLPTSSSFSLSSPSSSSPSPSPSPSTYGVVGVRDLAASGYSLTPRFVAESSFDWLHAEMVSYVINHTPNQTTPTDPPEVQSAARFAHAKKVYQKLDAMGFQVGVRLCERYTRDQSWFIEQLDVIKFLCKDFWIAVFRKQVDKLQTNYKGIYVLHDSSFRWLSRFSALSPEHMSTTLLEDVRPYTHLACGIIRGALHNLGINANVKADIIKLPACQFTLVDVEKTEKARDTTNPTASTSTVAPTSAPTSARGADSVQASPASTNRTLPNTNPAPAAVTSTSTSTSTSVLSSPPTPTPVSAPTPASPEQSS